MNRRETVLALVALGATPLGAGAQVPKVPRIGVLLPEFLERYQTPFRQGLREFGYAEGQNILIEYRSAKGRLDRLGDLAIGLIRLKVDIIVAHTTPAVLAAERATTEIPIVMVLAGNPEQTGLVPSLGRPGGNITGVAGLGADSGAKQLELIRELRPAATRVAVLTYPTETEPFARIFLRAIQSAADNLGLQVIAVQVQAEGDLERAFMTMSGNHADLVLVQPLLGTKPVAELAMKHQLPSISAWSSYPESGGLISYSVDPNKAFRRAAYYIDKILKGARPGDLPIEQPTVFELVINKKTAKALDITIPPSLLLRVDRVID